MKSAAIPVLLATVWMQGAIASEEGSSELRFSLGTDLAYKQLDFSAIQATGGSRTKADLWTLAIAPAISYGRIFASLTGERSLGTSVDPSRNATTGAFTLPAYHTRSENSLTVGLRLWGDLAIFAGTMDNETERFIGDQSFLTYRDKGPFVGLSYSYSFSGGLLAASLAYASAETDFSQEISFGGGQSGTGDLTGTSFSLTWVVALDDSWTGRVGYRGTRYSADLAVNVFDATGVVTSSFTREADQDYDAFVIGVARAF